MLFWIVDIHVLQYNQYVCLNCYFNFPSFYKKSYNKQIKIFSRNFKTARIFGENPSIYSAIHRPISYFDFTCTSHIERVHNAWHKHVTSALYTTFFKINELFVYFVYAHLGSTT